MSQYAIIQQDNTLAFYRCKGALRMESFKFDIKITKEDLSSFLIYHNYTHFNGLFGIAVSIVAIAYLIFNFNHLEITTMAVLVIIGLLYTVVNPLMLRQRAVRQIDKVFALPITYELKAETFTLVQGDQKAEFLWKDVTKIKDNGRLMIIYVSKVRGFIWPKDQLGENYREIVEILRKNVDADKIKLKDK